MNKSLLNFSGKNTFIMNYRNIQEIKKFISTLGIEDCPSIKSESFKGTLIHSDKVIYDSNRYNYSKYTAKLKNYINQFNYYFSINRNKPFFGFSNWFFSIYQ